MTTQRSVFWLGLCAALATSSTTLLAHEMGADHEHPAADPGPPPVPLPTILETKGPVKTPKLKPDASPHTSGQGYWKFVARPDLAPVPEEAKPFLKGAHGTLVVDADRNIVYWGLEKVGWIAFSDRLTKSHVVKGDPTLAKGNLHGADLLRRPGQLPLVVAADNVNGRVFLSDTTFLHVVTLGLPDGEPYADKKGFAPTDAAFVNPRELYVTDGYGKAYFMPAGTEPFKYEGPIYGGKTISQTPHGITYDGHDQSLLVSARPEAEIKRWSLHDKKWKEVEGLPPGSTVCDVDLWGDYALAPCLDGPSQSPGPIYILNLKKKAIVSTLRPKADLGFAEAQHIHDACWYLTGKGSKRELYVIFTNWNPGGIGVMKLVNVSD